MKLKVLLFVYIMCSIYGLCLMIIRCNIFKLNYEVCVIWYLVYIYICIWYIKYFVGFKILYIVWFILFFISNKFELKVFI